MQVHKVPGCCSSVVIKDNPEFTDKATFLASVIAGIRHANNNRCKEDPISLTNIKNIIVITNKKWPARPLWLKKAYSYKGNSAEKANVCYVKTPKGLA
jgi:hypothetical protein